MDSVIDKEQRLSEGHSEAEEWKLDFEDLTDDEEVALDLHRKGAEERDPPGEEIRDLPGATISVAPVTQQEEWFQMEPLHGARPKWNRLGRPTSVIEEPRGLGVEATGGIDGLEATEGGMRAPAPQLPPPRQDRPSAGVVTPPRRDADIHRGLRTWPYWSRCPVEHREWVWRMHCRRIMDYRLQFEKTTQTAGEDPSIFAIVLETLAMKAFGDMGQTARLRVIRDRFIAGPSSGSGASGGGKIVTASGGRD